MIGAHDVMPKWRGDSDLTEFFVYEEPVPRHSRPKRQGLVEEEILSAAFESQNAEIA